MQERIFKNVICPCDLYFIYETNTFPSMNDDILIFYVLKVEF